MRVTLDLSFRVLSPLFLAGAEQARAELRAPSLKGALRFWYRAIDPGFKATTGPITREDRIFGGSAEGAGQSRVLLRIPPVRHQSVSWEPQRTRRFDQGQGKERRNGLVYLGFPFQLRGNDTRRAVAPGTEFRVQCVTASGDSKGHGRGLSTVERRGVLAACWLLGNLGSLGSRSRRGFGSLQLSGWPDCVQGDEEWRVDVAALPPMARLPDAAAWRKALVAARETFQGWFEPFSGESKHPHLGPKFRVVLLPKAFKGQAAAAWEDALNFAGRLLQDFRLRREPDYSQVKDGMRYEQRQGGKPLRQAPERVSFGLPLTFRYSSLKAPPVTFVPSSKGAHAPLERHGSLLLLRLVELGDGLHPLFVRLDGSLPGIEPPAVVRGRGARLEPPAHTAVDQFLDSLGGV